MIYLVSSVHRSGSSMMMRCLEAGGLIPVYDKQSDEMNKSAPTDYIPNPNGFYQFTYGITGDFAKLYDGRVMKCPIRELLHLPKHQYKLVFMRRDPKEIRASMGRWTPFHSWGRMETITYLYDTYVNALLNELSARGDFDITVLNYADVVANPLREFDKLSPCGVDIGKMVVMVQPELYRLKLEEV